MTTHTPTDTEVDFQQVLHDFHQAIHNILDPQHVTDLHGNNQHVPGLLDQITDGMTQRGGTTLPTGAYDSRPPIWIAGLDWLITTTRTITDAAGETHRARRHTPTDDALAWLTWALDAPWGPNHTNTLRHATQQLHTAHRTGMRLIYPELFTLNAPCPHCGTATTHDTDHTTRPTLTVHALWADCSHCHTTWHGADILHLAHALNQQDNEKQEEGEEGES